MRFSDLKVGDWFQFKEDSNITYIRIEEDQFHGRMFCSLQYDFTFTNVEKLAKDNAEVILIMQYEYKTKIIDKQICLYEEINFGTWYYPYGAQGDYSFVIQKGSGDIVVWQNNDYIPSMVGKPIKYYEIFNKVVLVPQQTFTIEEKEFI